MFLPLTPFRRAVTISASAVSHSLARPLLMPTAAAVATMTAQRTLAVGALTSMRRHQSTSATAASPKPTPVSSAARPTPTPAQPAAPTVTWTEYLSLRKDMRLRNQVFSFLMSPMAFVGATFYVAATYQFDPTETMMGIESPWIVGCGAMAVGAVAATMTPVTLEALWRVVNPTKVKKLDALDREFYRRIQKHRAHASLAGPQLHLFDYYGATVVSRETYRKWLRKQRKTKQKAEFLVQSSKIKSA